MLFRSQALEVLRLVANRYPGAKMFAERVESALAATPSRLDEIAAPIRSALEDWRAALAFIRADTAEAARHARRLMTFMADIVAAALLLEDASASLVVGDCRKALVARFFVESRISPLARRGIVPGRDWIHRHFQGLATYAVIEPPMSGNV